MWHKLKNKYRTINDELISSNISEEDLDFYSRIDAILNQK